MEYVRRKLQESLYLWRQSSNQRKVKHQQCAQGSKAGEQADLHRDRIVYVAVVATDSPIDHQTHAIHRNQILQDHTSVLQRPHVLTWPWNPIEVHLCRFCSHKNLSMTSMDDG